MQTFEIKNPRVLALLERLRYLYIDKYDIARTNNLMCSPDEDANLWLSTEYRDSIIGMGEDHNGAPETARSYAIKPKHYKGSDPEYLKDYAEVDSALRTELGVKVNALSQLYPPEGFISWHNNANASGYNLIFTWSETGDGWFKYIDQAGQEVTMHDTKGWSLKAGYFGGYDDGYTCYHAAYTKCWRMTHSFILAKDEDYWLDCLDYIQYM